MHLLPVRWRAAWANPGTCRLHADIDVLTTHLEGPGRDSPACQRARTCLQEAQAAVERGEAQRGWAFLFQAREELVQDYSRGELLALASALEDETVEPAKVTAWRRANIIEQVRRFRSTRDDDISRAAVRMALEVRNEGILNEYWRLSITRHYQMVLLCIAAPFMVMTVVLLAKSLPHMDDPQWRSGAWPCVIAILIGVLGALASAAQRATRVTAQRIAVQLGSSVNSLSRVPLGAAAGFGVWLFTRATVPGADFTVMNMFLAAFGAGFSERLVVQSIARDETAPASVGTTQQPSAERPAT